MRGSLHKPTDETRALVRQYVTDGMIQEHIAAALGISADTLARHYRDDLTPALEDWKTRFAESIKQRVLKEDCAPALVIFTAKAQLGWREQVPLDPDRKKPEDMTLDEIRARVAEFARAEREASGDPARVRKAS
jgi:hypothetical protein